MGIYNLGGGGGAPELQAKEATPLITNAQQIILPDEGYDGLSKVTVNPMPAGTLKTPTVNSIGYVSSGVQTAGYFDTSATSGLQLSTQAAKTITPTTYSQTAVASGKYTTGAVTVAGDANLVPENILINRKIYGVTGTMMGYFIIPSGNVTILDSYTISAIVPISIVNKITGIKLSVDTLPTVSVPRYPNIANLDTISFYEKNSFDSSGYHVYVSRLNASGYREYTSIPVRLITNKTSTDWEFSVKLLSETGYTFDVSNPNIYNKICSAIITS